MQKFLTFAVVAFLVFSCKQAPKNDAISTIEASSTNANQVQMASGFTLTHYDDYSILEVSNPWPESDISYSYLLYRDQASDLPDGDFNARIQIPVQSLVVTSTTHIPSLEALQSESKLVGFPSTNYISSQKTRALIDAGQIKELSGTQDMNMEVLIDLNPEVVVGFGVDGPDKSMELVEKAGIPVVFNGDWVEQHPLGKAEWIKFFGALLDKNEEATRYYNSIAADYNKAKALAGSKTAKQTVISGAMYKDVWYLPKGDSWAAQLIEDANGSYLYKDTKGTGSLSLNVESVLEHAADADFWIGPGQFTSLLQMQETNPVYSQFLAFKNKQVYSFTTKKGATGGVIYYELAPNRPDLVLKDMIKILHPELLSTYNLTFFAPLD